MQILLIDDDFSYIEIALNHFKDLGYQLNHVETRAGLESVDLEEYDLIMCDHTLGWGVGIQEIERLQMLCNADFALISTDAPPLYTVETIKNERITGIFSKWDFEKLKNWLTYSEEKKRYLKDYEET